MKVCIEGNIGAGKSTIIEHLRKIQADWDYVPEPIDAWAPWLSRFYANKNRWAFSLQMRVLASFAFEPGWKSSNHQQSVTVIERSCLSCRYVFGQTMFNQGYLSEKEWDLFKKYYDTVSWNPDLLIYVRTVPSECMNRVNSRIKASNPVAGDELVDLEYVKKIDFQYQNLLNFFQGNVVVIDGSKPASEIAELIVNAIKEQSNQQ